MFIITDNLEILSSTVFLSLKNLDIHSSSLEHFEAGFSGCEFPKKEDLLVVVNAQYYERPELLAVCEFFDARIGAFPHLLFVSNQPHSVDEQEKIARQENFFYQLPSDPAAVDSSFYSYLMLIFQHTKDLQRLSKYIVDSFQTIVDAELIQSQKLEIEKLYRELDELSKVDVLTNVLNRRAFYEAMEIEKKRTLRNIWRFNQALMTESEAKEMQIKFQQSIKPESLESDNSEIQTLLRTKPRGSFSEHFGRLSCMMLDIDNFKIINDTYGHLTGDEVLKRLGQLLKSREIFRENDVVGRFGGEEFVVLLPDTRAELAVLPAERLRKAFGDIEFRESERRFHVTVSIGVAELELGDDSSDDVIQKADEALYYSKHHGKDMVTVYDDIKNE